MLNASPKVQNPDGPPEITKNAGKTKPIIPTPIKLLIILGLKMKIIKCTKIIKYGIKINHSKIFEYLSKIKPGMNKIIIAIKA